MGWQPPGVPSRHWGHHISLGRYDGNLSLLSYRAEDSGRRGRDTFEVAARENAVDGTESTAVLSEGQLLIGSHL